MSVVLLLLLVGLGAEQLSKGVYSERESHIHMSLAPPMARGVPQWNPEFDGDPLSFEILDRDQSGAIECTRVQGSQRFQCPEIQAARKDFRFFRSFFPNYDKTGNLGVPDGFLEASEFPERDAFPSVFQKEGWGEPGHFIALDQNRDGRISPSEVNEATRVFQIASDAMMAYDADGNGKIDRREFPGSPRTAPFYLGCDELGRDVWTRVIRGGATSLRIAVGATLISLFLGCFLGGIAGYRGGVMDRTILRLGDIWMALPTLILVIVVVAALGSSPARLMLLFGVLNWVSVARLVRMQVRSLRAETHVEAARAMGAHPLRIAVHHMLRVGWRPVGALGIWLIAIVVAEEGALSFLGLGVPAPAPSWGGMLAEGIQSMRYHPRLVIIPGFLFALTVFVLNMLETRVSEEDR